VDGIGSGWCTFLNDARTNFSIGTSQMIYGTGQAGTVASIARGFPLPRQVSEVSSVNLLQTSDLLLQRSTRT
jgi:hypothetical protein